MRILVTGASGFVGLGLIQTLAAEGYEVRAAAREPSRLPARDNVEPATLPNLAQDVDWAALLSGIDVVIHLAGIAHATSRIPDAVYDQVNRAATESLARAAAARNIRVIFLSSIRAQSGPVADNPLNEDDAPRPTDAYGRSKLAAERALTASGAAFTILRPVVIYGPGVKGNVASLLRLAQSPLPLPFGKCKNLRSLLALDNLTGAILFVLQNDAAVNQTYSVADPAPVTFAEIIRALREGSGRPARLLGIPAGMLMALLAALGKRGIAERINGTLVADAHKLRMAGWRPTVDTRRGLAGMAQAASPRKSGTASRSTR